MESLKVKLDILMDFSNRELHAEQHFDTCIKVCFRIQGSAYSTARGSDDGTLVYNHSAG